ncbi:hypothetical protein [Deinococcus pimensis]|uniref:hypothetical protein n=1 Tax=Deinococcus pimensis TaxID=309888 RepID=UPI000487626D|nr:hypothetical protein [Deinococcus pimensis]
MSRAALLALLAITLAGCSGVRPPDSVPQGPALKLPSVLPNATLAVNVDLPDQPAWAFAARMWEHPEVIAPLVSFDAHGHAELTLTLPVGKANSFLTDARTFAAVDVPTCQGTYSGAPGAWVVAVGLVPLFTSLGGYVGTAYLATAEWTPERQVMGAWMYADRDTHIVVSVDCDAPDPKPDIRVRMDLDLKAGWNEVTRDRDVLAIAPAPTETWRSGHPAGATWRATLGVISGASVR